VPLSQSLENRFRADIRFRGEAYAQTNRVQLTRVTSDAIHAIVDDGTEQKTCLTRSDNQLEMACSCRNGTLSEANCKHVWATLLAAEQEGYISPSARPGYIPPFRSAAEPAEAPATALGAVVPGRTEGETETWQGPKAPVREWEARLAEIEDYLDEWFRKVRATPVEGEVWYVIDAEASRQSRRLVLKVLHRKRRSDGQWGPLKPLRIAVDELGRLPDESDRRVLASFSAAAEEPSRGTGPVRENKSLPHRFSLPGELCRLLMPVLCQTGRLVLDAPGGKPGTPLSWDDGPAWQLDVNVRYDNDGEAYSVSAELSRPGQTCPLQDVTLALPGGLVVIGGRIGRLENEAVSEWLTVLAQGHGLRVAEDDVDEFLERLLGLPALPRLTLPDRLGLRELQPDPIPQLLLSSPQLLTWQPQRLVGGVFFDYAGHVINAVSRRGAIVDRANRLLICRNQPREAERWAELQDAGFRRVRGAARQTGEVEIGVAEVGRAVRQLIQRGWVVKADGRHVRQPGAVHLRVKSRIDWFELHGEVDFGGRSVKFPELLSALARGDSAIKLDDGSFGILPDEWRRQYALMAEIGVLEEKHIRFRNDQVGLLDVLLAAEPTVDYDKRFEDLRAKIRSFDGIAPVDEPEGFHGTLRQYQKEGLGWLKFLQQFRFGGCLADDMGLGKTVQMLALLQDRRNSRKRRKPSLVVVPKSLMFNWHQECDRFTPELRVLEYSGADRAELRKSFRDYDVILTTYGTLRRDILDLKDFKFDYVVLDEAQTIKNPRSQIAKAVRLLQCEHRIALSGTPIENHISDLWSIFEFLNPGMLGRSSILKLGTRPEEDAQSLELLRRGLRPFILRRTKAQVASYLPEKVEQTIYCEMDEEQRRLYDEMRDHYRTSLLEMVRRQGIARSTMHVLEALLRLRQAACHPALLDPARQDETSAKLDVLCTSLEQLLDEGHKALVFSQFTSMLAIVRRHLDRMGLCYAYLDGRTRNRKEVVERFQSDAECGVFLISLKAGGFGLNLTAADYVFLFDPWWNPAVESQAIDRSHRIGQDRQVFAYRLICRDTVEEKIEQLQQRKRQLAKALLHEDGSLLKAMTAEDLELLLS